jgi:hypothetical protein
VKLIGLCGLIGSGKNTVAERLMGHYDYVGVSFAGTLKDAASCIFGWDRDMLEGSTSRDREERERKDLWWSERLGFDVSPRYMLQFLGTEVMRSNLHSDIWVYATEKEILENPWDQYVITDVRFPNEVAMIRRHGGKILHVRRGDLPEWFGQDPNDVHASETAWNNERFDATIRNDGTIEELYENLDKLLEMW